MKESDPDTTFSAEEREIEVTWNIHMVKKSMDEMNYEYKKRSENILYQKEYLKKSGKAGMNKFLDFSEKQP